MPDQQLPAPVPAGSLAVQALGRRVRATGLPVVGYLAGILLLAAAYWIAGRASLALQYEGPVAAIWLPVGVGASALYLGGLRWWPGVLIGDLLLVDTAQSLGTALGITAGNMVDLLVIAVLLRRLLGPRAALDRLEQVAGMLIAIATGAAVTATVAVLSLRLGGSVGSSEMAAFWRSWFLADASGALVVIPLALAWAQPRSGAWPRRRVWEGALMVVAVVGLSTIALSAELHVTYMVFPALIWAALRFGQRGATLAVAVAAGIAVGITANEVGAFVMQSMTESALTTQLYIAVAALTTLCLAAIVSERRRAVLEVAQSRARIAAAGAQERRRLEGELHDSAQNRLVGLVVRLRLLQGRTVDTTPDVAATVGGLMQEAEAIADELRRIAHGLSPPLLATRGLVEALKAEAALSGIAVQITARDVALSTPDVENAVYLCCLESIQNAAKHAGPDATVTVRLRCTANELSFRVEDTGVGFDPRSTAPGAGLTGVRDRIAAIGGRVRIIAAPGRGTTVTGVVPWPPRTV